MSRQTFECATASRRPLSRQDNVMKEQQAPPQNDGKAVAGLAPLGNE
jgi:hypothetical protein